MGQGSIRLFVTAPLTAGAIVPATATQAHYLRRVMRRRDGDTVLLFNGRDGEWQATNEAGGRTAAFRVRECVRAQAADADLWLAFALLKRDATDLVVRQSTELGVARICPFVAERSQGERVNLDRLAAIAIEAAEQCERLTLPEISPPVPLATLLGEWPRERPLAALIERGWDAELHGVEGPAGLLVGPEGGLTSQEVAALRTAPFTVPASLGPRILRAETAAAAGLARLQAPAPGIGEGLDTPRRVTT